MLRKIIIIVISLVINIVVIQEVKATNSPASEYFKYLEGELNENELKINFTSIQALRNRGVAWAMNSYDDNLNLHQMNRDLKPISEFLTYATKLIICKTLEDNIWNKLEGIPHTYDEVQDCSKRFGIPYKELKKTIISKLESKNVVVFKLLWADFATFLNKWHKQVLIPYAMGYSKDISEQYQMLMKRNKDLKKGKVQPETMDEAIYTYSATMLDLSRVPLDANKKNYRVEGKIVSKKSWGWYLAKHETWNDIRYFKFKPNKKYTFSEGDGIEIIGTLVDIEIYETAMGTERRMPVLKVIYMEREKTFTEIVNELSN